MPMSSNCSTIRRMTSRSKTDEVVDLTGGRIETRRHTVCHKVDRMTSDRHYPGEPVFPDLAMIGRIETTVERNGKIEQETRYYLCSLALCALSFAGAVRGHWGVENRLHWVLDVVFRDDLARSGPAMDPRTWLSSAIPRSICCHGPDPPSV